MDLFSGEVINIDFFDRKLDIGGVFFVLLGFLNTKNRPTLSGLILVYAFTILEGILNNYEQEMKAKEYKNGTVCKEKWFFDNFYGKVNKNSLTTLPLVAFESNFSFTHKIVREREKILGSLNPDIPIPACRASGRQGYRDCLSSGHFGRQVSGYCGT